MGDEEEGYFPIYGMYIKVKLQRHSLTVTDTVIVLSNTSKFINIKSSRIHNYSKLNYSNYIKSHCVRK